MIHPISFSTKIPSLTSKKEQNSLIKSSLMVGINSSTLLENKSVATTLLTLSTPFHSKMEVLCLMPKSNSVTLTPVTTFQWTKVTTKTRVFLIQDI